MIARPSNIAIKHYEIGNDCCDDITYKNSVMIAVAVIICELNTTTGECHGQLHFLSRNSNGHLLPFKSNEC